MRTGALLLFWVLAMNAGAQRMAKPLINAPYDGAVNPFRQVLGLSTSTTSLNRDSARIQLRGGGSIDLILSGKRLWRFRQYDDTGMPLDAGDLTQGTGTVRFEQDDRLTEVALQDGVLNGPLTVSTRRKGEWVKMEMATFKDGLLEGEARRQSMWDPRYTSVRTVYEAGVMQLVESYGRQNWLWAWVLVVPRFHDQEKVCRRSHYVDGQLDSQECLLSRKCKSCGLH
jgi:hypothetical protein